MKSYTGETGGEWGGEKKVKMFTYFFEWPRMEIQIGGRGSIR